MAIVIGYIMMTQTQTFSSKRIGLVVFFAESPITNAYRPIRGVRPSV